jgi:hypothetical protein
MSDMLQILGAVMILGAFALLQFHKASQHSYSYLFLNLIGSALLALLVFTSHQWGFLLLEGAWVLIALWGIMTRMRATVGMASSRRYPFPWSQQEQHSIPGPGAHPMKLRKVVLCRDAAPQEPW